MKRNMRIVLILGVLVLLGLAVGIAAAQDPEPLRGEVGIQGVTSVQVAVDPAASLNLDSAWAADPRHLHASFNSDGYADLAVGVPLENNKGAGMADSGVVNILHGSSTGLSATGNQIWDQDSAGIAGQAELSDVFGQALATGDFNGDGRTDLAVGVPFENNEGAGVADSGVVNILYGSSTGLSATGNQIWDQDSAGIAGQAEPSDWFGRALACTTRIHIVYRVYLPLILREN